MTILALNSDGLAHVSAALRRAEAVIIPLASPLPYVVAATTASSVNELKGRPRAQACGMPVGHLGSVAPHLDLDPTTIELARWIALVERASLFVPLLPDAPNWLRSTSVNGFAGLTVAWLEQTSALADELGYLSVSSANLTSAPVAVSAHEADRIFDGERLVLDGDPYRNASAPQGSATIIEVRRQGALRVVRDGINNRLFGADPAAYLEALRERFARDRPRDLFACPDSNFTPRRGPS